MRATLLTLSMVSVYVDSSRKSASAAILGAWAGDSDRAIASAHSVIIGVPGLWKSWARQRATAWTRLGSRRPGDTRTIGMCAVAGHEDNSFVVSCTSASPSDASIRIRSGTWQDALTIVSKLVRASATRKPRSSSWRVRRVRDAGFAAAISTSGSAIDDADVADVAVRAICKFSALTVCNSDIDRPP